MPDNHFPTRAEGWEIADLVAVGVLDAVTGQPPVPISVWRASDRDDAPTDPNALFEGLTPRVAAILIAIYTDPGDLVLDATSDPTVAGAAGAGGRTYLPLSLDRAPSQALVPGRSAGLVLLRWPTPGLIAGDAVLACAEVLAVDGHTVVILAPPVDGIYRDHAHDLITTAANAGLGYLQHVVVITSTEPEGEGAREAGQASQRSRRGHLDLLVLVLRPPQKGRRP